MGAVGVFKKALVPLDGSDEGARILPHVVQIARRLGAELLLVSVLDPHESGIPQTDFSKYAVDADGRARQYLRHQIARLAEQGVTAGAWISTGDPSEQIVGVAAHHECDLIAMTTHGRTALGRGILGPTTDRVVHSSPLPVLTVRPADEPLGRRPVTRVLVPLDGSELAERALPHAELLARGMSAEVLLVRVVSAMQTQWLDPAPAAAAKIQAAASAAAEEYLDRVAGMLRRDGLSVDTARPTGHVAGSIMDLAGENPGTVVVMASHGRSGVLRWAIGSVAEATVRGSGVPVLIVPARGEDA
jgi:nucleotide-binding universal stress UspA family protein